MTICPDRLKNQMLSSANFASDYLVSCNRLDKCEAKYMMKEENYFCIIQKSRPIRV